MSEKEENKVTISKKEKDSRIDLYNKKLEENKNKDSVKKEYKFEESTITNKDEIINGIESYINEKISFKISEGKSNFKFENILFKKINENEIVIFNPFHNHSDKAYPQNSQITVDYRGSIYTFNLTPIKTHKNGTIDCKIPESIKVVKMRQHERVDDHKATPVGMFLRNKNKEFIGSVKDISKSGIGFYIDDSILDNDSLSIIKDDSDTLLPIIIDNFGKHLSIAISIKYIKHNKNKNRVEVGAEFNFSNDEEKETISKIVDKKIKEDQFFNQKLKSLELINKAKTGFNI